ncbi:MAG TPA: hypothetical protein IAA58_07055 [Candidatus Gallacutalibacter stercoravium]|nr:hypothetical protein [Candidatus Gallacutalibacter stercoravium]
MVFYKSALGIYIAVSAAALAIAITGQLYAPRQGTLFFALAVLLILVAAVVLQITYLKKYNRIITRYEQDYDVKNFSAQLDRRERGAWKRLGKLQVRLNQSTALIEQGQFAEAISLLLSLEPGLREKNSKRVYLLWGSFYGNLSAAYIRVGDVASAQGCLGQLQLLLDQPDGLPDVKKKIKQAYLTNYYLLLLMNEPQNAAGAVEYFRVQLQETVTFRQQSNYQFYLANALLVAGRTGEAVELLRRTAALSPELYIARQSAQLLGGLEQSQAQ